MKTLGTIIVGAFALVVNWSIHTFFNAIGAWIILDQLSVSVGFWSYVFIGVGLTFILNGNTTSSD